MKPPLRGSTCGARAGFTLIELLIGTVILFVLALSLVESISNVSRMSTDGSLDSQLQTMGERAIKTIVTQLKRSGFTDDGAYPHVFFDGTAGAGFSVHDHLPAVQYAQPGDPDFGASSSIVFVQPADLDADGIPDLDGAGDLVWNATDSSFVLITRADGINYLERRQNAGAPQVVAHHVERATFETQADDPFLPLNAVRARIWLRQRDEQGAWHRFYTEATVHPRN